MFRKEIRKFQWSSLSNIKSPLSSPWTLASGRKGWTQALEENPGIICMRMLSQKIRNNLRAEMTNLIARPRARHIEEKLFTVPKPNHVPNPSPLVPPETLFIKKFTPTL